MLKKRPAPKRIVRARVDDDFSDIEVIPISEIEYARSWVLYGRSGSGKTTLAATFPKPILYLDIRDKGTDSIADIGDIDVIRVTSFAHFEKVYWAIVKNKLPRKYNTVVIDTVSQLQTLLVSEYAAKAKRKGKSAGDWGSLTRRDWGDIASQLKETLNDYRDLTEEDIEVIFIAQDRVFNVEEEDDTLEMPPPEVGPSLTPSVARSLNASVSVVANTFIRQRIIKSKEKGKKPYIKMQYCLGIGPSAIYTRKVRKPKSEELPEFVVNPDYESLINMIKGE